MLAPMVPSVILSSSGCVLRVLIDDLPIATYYIRTNGPMDFVKLKQDMIRVCHVGDAEIYK